MIKEGNIFIRKMNETDYERLTIWLNNREVAKFYDGEQYPHHLANVIEKYEPRVRGNYYVKPCIVEYENMPIGYIQYYLLDLATKKEYGYKETENVIGMDQFIGETRFINKGIGMKMIKVLITYLIDKYDSAIFVMDPHSTNKRAIRCYEKCCFVKKRRMNKEYWLMEYKR
ncbi:MAG: GNAT family N-acetyltransferase [Bacillaceae bacterium]